MTQFLAAAQAASHSRGALHIGAVRSRRACATWRSAAEVVAQPAIAAARRGLSRRIRCVLVPWFLGRRARCALLENLLRADRLDQYEDRLADRFVLDLHPF